MIVLSFTNLQTSNRIESLRLGFSGQMSDGGFSVKTASRQDSESKSTIASSRLNTSVEAKLSLNKARNLLTTEVEMKRTAAKLNKIVGKSISFEAAALLILIFQHRNYRRRSGRHHRRIR